MPYEKIRTITGLATIPEGTAQDGTVTGSTASTGEFLLDFTPAASPAIQSFFDIWDNSRQNRLWIWIPGEEILARVLSVWTDTRLEVDRDVSSVTNQAFQSVFMDLKGWSATNIGAGAGEIDGQVLAVGQNENANINYENKQNWMSAHWLDGTGTTIRVIEQS